MNTFNTPWRIKSIARKSSSWRLQQEDKLPGICHWQCQFVACNIISIYMQYVIQLMLRSCVAISAFSFAFWRQCARWRLKRRRSAPVATTRNYLVYTHAHTLAHARTRTHTRWHARTANPEKESWPRRKGKTRKFLLEIQAIAFEKFQFLPVASAAHVASCPLPVVGLCQPIPAETNDRQILSLSLSLSSSFFGLLYFRLLH